jgi:hypothetical protein
MIYCFAHHGSGWTILLDGKPVPNAVLADEEAGTVYALRSRLPNLPRNARSLAAIPFATDEQDRLILERREGRVEVRPRP